jgi:hypothetical protein
MRKMLHALLGFVLVLGLMSNIAASFPKFSGAPEPVGYSDSILSFLDHLCSATWYGGGLQTKEVKLACPGSDTDDKGFVKPLGANFTLETDQRAEHSFETHPMWVNDGFIFGVFGLSSLGIELRAGDRFLADVGFLKGAAAGEVRFSVWYTASSDGSGTKTKLAEVDDRHDGALKSINVSLSNYAGGGGAIVLRVDSRGSSAQDWAVWVNPRIERQQVLEPTFTPFLPTASIATPTASPMPTSTPPPSPTPTLIDHTPPKIIAGPSVSQLTETSATICWQTDEPSDSRVEYDLRTGKPGLFVEDPQPVEQHCLTLTGLSLATTYRFVSLSRDAAGNRASSREQTFTTLSPQDNEKPMAVLDLPEELSGDIPIAVDAVDNIAVDRVIFLIDGQPVTTDYSLPYEANVDTRELEDGEHIFGAWIFDFAGNRSEILREGNVRNRFPIDESPVDVYITNPASRDEVYGWVAIEADIFHEHGTPIERVQFRLDGEVLHDCDIEYMALGPIFNPDTGRREMMHTGEPPLHEVCYWDFMDEEDGHHEIEVQAWEPYNTDQADLLVTRIDPPPPEVNLEITREFERVGNYFEVTLTVRNAGGDLLDELIVHDESIGFQVVEDRDLGITYDVARQATSVSKNLGRMSPGRTATLEYELVPVLYDPPLSRYGYLLGLPTVYVEYQDTYDRPYSAEARVTHLPAWSYREAILAITSADYLIVTNPSHLFDPPAITDDVNTLLATMAELARAKMGALGYLERGTTNEELKGLISPFNPRRDIPESYLWYMQLPESWVLNGYMLIVGEAEIVPPWELTFCGEYTSDTYDLACEGSYNRATINIELSDNPYANVLGGDGKPDLRIGRIIGNTAQELTVPLRTSLDKGSSFDRSNALVVSGPENAGDLPFINWIRSLTPILEGQGIAVEATVHSEYFDTEVTLLREALVILGTRWDYDPATTKGEPPSSLSDLSPLIGVYDCMGEPGHHNDDGTLCLKNHPPTDLADLHAMISKEQAERVWAAVRDYDQDYAVFSDGCDAMAARARAIKAGASNKDVIVWTGHGGDRSWGATLDGFISGVCGDTDLRIDFPAHPINFGSTAPVVTAASCLTGYYEPDDDNGIAEAFTRLGAADYLGCTRSLGGGSAAEFQRQFYETFWTPERTLGEAILLLKNHLIDNDQMDINQGGYREWLRVSHIFNLFGDPKFGSVSTTATLPFGRGGVSMIVASTGAWQEWSQQSLTSFHIDVPQYAVTEIGEFDYVDIPGGLILPVQGLPRLPIYSASLELPAGERVQDVVLVERSAPEALTGLWLPVVDQREICQASGAPLEALSEGWYPDQDYDYEVWENPDGSSTLTVKVYPFRYDPSTGEGEFYRTYDFELQMVSTDLTINAVSGTNDVDGIPGRARIDVWLHGPDQGQDAILGVVLKSYGSGEVLAGFPIQLLRGLGGDSSYSVTLDAVDVDLSRQYAEVTLYDGDGNVLARRSAGFSDEPPEAAESLLEPTQKTAEPPIPLATGLVLLVILALVGVAMLAGALVIARRRNR